MEKSNDIIILDKVSRYFKMGNISVKALDDFTYSFKKNKITAVVGKSGSGKSTLLNLIGCLEKPSSEKILVDGQDVSKFTETGSILFRREKIGFIFQSFNLIPNLTVIENVLLPLEFSRIKKNPPT
ncbi:MAG: ABC transporter ATP-binding protein, partial [Actinobacteria bacterium]|nr:ABC transporter ATP-binding protein [Actinomycetota bacterium]